MKQTNDKKDIILKEKTVKQLYKSVIIRNSICFASMTAFMLCVLSGNLNNTRNGLWLLLFLAVVTSFCSCFFEMRVVRKTGEFLMPTARILMFLSKPIIFVLGYVVMILSFKSAMENYLKYLFLCLYLVVATGLFYFWVTMLFRKKDSIEVCYIDYTLSKVTKTKNRESAIFGIITTTILLMGVVALFAVYLIKQKSDYFTVYDHFTILGFIIISCMLIGCEFFYLQEFIKKKIKMKNSALNEKERESDDEKNDK